jgi:hypothetical protein
VKPAVQLPKADIRRIRAIRLRTVAEELEITEALPKHRLSDLRRWALVDRLRAICRIQRRCELALAGLRVSPFFVRLFGVQLT